jgi:hypothetical protein
MQPTVLHGDYIVVDTSTYRVQTPQQGDIVVFRYPLKELANDPSNLTLHFGLATCASWLGLVSEATDEFNCVLARAPHGSAERTVAGEWLEGAARTTRGTEHTAADASGSKVGDAAVHGLVTWEVQGEPHDVLRRAQLHMKGLPDSPTKGLAYYVRTDKEGRYHFQRIKPGPYRLTDAIAGSSKWNLKIEVKSGEDLELNLSNSNSVAHRNDFPPAGGS